MFEKSFITDCEGPLTLNDNAFELCEHFIDDGDKLFKILIISSSVGIIAFVI